MKRLKIFIAVVLLTAAILGLIRPRKKVQTPGERILDLVARIVSAFSMPES